MRYLTIGIILCAILAADKMTNHLLNQIRDQVSSYNVIMYQTLFDLSFYLIPPVLLYQFKERVYFYALIFCWISMDAVTYSGIARGWEKHAWYAIFNLITLSYFAIQYKRNVNIIISFGIMVLFQLFMILDWFNGDSETVLYDNYHYILTGIHLLIISTMVKWTIINRCRAYFDYYCRRLFLVFG